MNDTEAVKSEHSPYTIPAGMRTSKVVPRLIAFFVLALSTTVYARQIADLEAPDYRAEREFEINAMLHSGMKRWNIRDKESAACVGYFETEIREAPEGDKAKKPYRAFIHIKGYARLAETDAPATTDIDLTLEFDDFFTLKKISGTLSTPELHIQLSSNKKRILKAVTSIDGSTYSREYPNALNMYVKRKQENRYILKYPFKDELSRASTFPGHTLQSLDALPAAVCHKANVAEDKGQIDLSPFVQKILN